MMNIESTVTAQLPATDEHLKELRDARKKDATLQKLHHLTYNGWPSKKSSVPLDVQTYWNVRYAIHEE